LSAIIQHHFRILESDLSNLIPNLQRVLKRLDRALSGPIVEFSEQFLYGHREILIDYAGLEANSMIKGSVEHGWALDSGRGIRKLTGGRYLYLSWSRARVARSGVSDDTTVAIGAPFIYAFDKVEAQIKEFLKEFPVDPSRILFFPVHGNEFSQQNPDSQIALFKEKYDPKNVTVSLYWVEYINPIVYNLYKEAGFKIVCSGFSGQMEHTGLGYSARRLAGSPIGGRPVFILNTIAMLATHSKVVFGGLGTGLFYAGYMRKDIEMLHKYLTTTFLDMDSERGTSFEAHPLEARYVRHVADYMGCNFDEIDYNTDKFHKLADLELGKADMRSSDQLREIFQKYINNSANIQSLGVYQENLSKFNLLLKNYSSPQ
jgi:hypothetical protein